MNQKANISKPISMDRDTHLSQLKADQYSLAINISTETETGERLNITNEPSNYLTLRFPSGYKVIGFKVDLLSNRTYFWLTNPTTGKSSIGYINSTQIEDSNVDAYNECGDCDKANNQLGVPLETVTQTPSHQYIELVNDACHSKEEGLELDINYPIKFIELKSEKFGTRAYWDDNKNPSRYLDLDALEEARVSGVPSYLFRKEVPCEEDEIVDCPIISKLRHFPLHTVMHIEPSTLQTGGNLKMGTYEFYGVYCDLLGNELTNYSVPSNPISIFDENNSLLEATELDSFTNFAIKLTVENLDLTFPYYKIVCVERTSVDNKQSGFVAGIYPTTDNTVLYTSSGSANDDEYLATGNSKIVRRVDLYTLFRQRPMYEKAVGTMASGNRLFKWGLQKKSLVNLQPVVNLFGSLLKWQTSVAKEDLYKNAIATSKYKGFMRNEVQPFALRFFNKDGSYSAAFPLIGRPANSDELSTVNDKNFQSISENTPNCTVDTRNKKWQIFNTASENKRVGDDSWNCDYDVEVVESTEDIYKTCVIEEVATIPAGSAIITENVETFLDLETYILDNPELEIPGITSYLEAEYPSEHCTPLYNNCDTPELVDNYNSISEISGETYEYITKSENSYDRTPSPSFCTNYSTDADGNKVKDTQFQTNFMDCDEIVYKRSTPSNESCQTATSINDNTGIVEQAGVAHFHKYYGDDVKSNLLSTKDAFVSDSDFDTKLHKGALWFKAQKNNRNKIIFEVTPTSNCEEIDDLSTSTKLRYTIYKDCNTTTAFDGGIFNTSSGVIKELNTTTLPSTFYVAIDAPIETATIAVDCLAPGTTKTVFRVKPTCGCFTPFTRNVEFSSINVGWTEIKINKTEKYKATCNFSLPKVNDCDPIPFAQGEFAYWESTEEYPNNDELYNSSKLRVFEEDLSILNDVDKQNFKNFYMGGNLGQLIEADTDFRCKKIRHFKMPDNTVAPFMSSATSKPFADSLIFPLGVTIDNNVIKTLLQVAYKNKLITQKELDNIQGFEILKGDNSVQKSIIANGLGYDMYKYKRENKFFYYANYPFNDLGQDILHYDDNDNNTLIQHPFQGNGNNKFSIISPDLVYQSPSLPTEVVLSGYQLGSSKGKFIEVKEHPKWVILGQKARNRAEQLGIAEALLEATLKVIELNARGWAVFGLSSGASGGWVAAVAAGVALATQQALKVSQYRYQWLKTFRDLGEVYNFATYNVAHGHHNYFVKNIDESEYLRGLSLRKYIKDGEYTYIDENSNERLSVNNKLREHSVLLSTGNYNFDYSTDYKNYDNNLFDKNTSSKTISSENNCKVNEEYIRNVGSPYFTLKNYIPDQYGTIDSVKWLTTNYKFNLSEETECRTIFGGTVSISRFTWKRKIPIFTATAMGLPDKLAVEYSPYKNIGTPVYYCDYETDSDYKFLGLPAPDIRSVYNFDCPTPSNRMYIRPDSKFYLYYYGVTDFLVESEINCNFRYGKRELKNQFYPQVGDLEEWTQQVNVPIKEPNTFYYNNIYSLPVSNTPYDFLDRTFNKEEWDKRNTQENAVIYSEMDNSQNDIVDPWLVYKPANWHEFDKKYGKLIALKDLESFQVLGRFEEGMLVFNAVDSLADRITPQNKEVGTAGIFATRPLEFKRTDLGFAGTQHSDMSSNPYGHFWVDAKRGKIFMLDQSGRDLQPISEILGGQPSNMKNWFREHVPMKILKQFPNIDIDNKFKGIGYNIWYDERKSRVFFTKRDYIGKKDDCLKYDRDNGFYTDCGEDFITCPEGYTYNVSTQNCEKTFTTSQICPTGYTYNTINHSCVLTETIAPTCVCTANVTATNQTICSGETTSINLTSTEIGISFKWTASQSGVTGASSGTGSTIAQTLSGVGTVTYTVTPFETEALCEGTPITVTATVKAIPNVTATIDKVSIVSGDTFTITLASNLSGTNFSWTVNNNGTSGPTSGSGSSITATINGAGNSVYTITPEKDGCAGTPIDVVVSVGSLVIDDKTQINIWFDDSGSMNSTLSPLQTMASTILKPCLLPAFNNDSALYDQRVKVRNFSSVSSGYERYIGLLGQTSTDSAITRVINLTFADESNDYGAEVAYNNVITLFASQDISFLRNIINTKPANSVVGVAFQVRTLNGQNTAFPGFRDFVNRVHTGAAPFTGANGLSDKTEIGFKLDVTAGGVPQYYANLIVEALNNLGFSLNPC